jgi:hypothetical protein
MRGPFRINGLRMSRSDPHYLTGLGGAQGLGTSKLQIPILRQASFPRMAAQQRIMATAVDQAVAALRLSALPVQGEALEVQFAVIDLASNSEMANYQLLSVNQEWILKIAASIPRISISA